MAKISSNVFGAGFNFISAMLMLFFIGLIWGSPSSVPLITNVNKGSKAAVAGLEKEISSRK